VKIKGIKFCPGFILLKTLKFRQKKNKIKIMIFLILNILLLKSLLFFGFQEIFFFKKTYLRQCLMEIFVKELNI